MQTDSVTNGPVTAPCSATMAQAAARAPAMATAGLTTYGQAVREAMTLIVSLP